MRRLSKSNAVRKAAPVESGSDRTLRLLRDRLEMLSNDLADERYKHEDGAGYSKWGFVMASVMKRAMFDSGERCDNSTLRAMFDEVLDQFDTDGQLADRGELDLLLRHGLKVCVLPEGIYPDEWCLYLTRTGHSPKVAVDRARYPTQRAADDATLLVNWLYAFGLWRDKHPSPTNDCAFLATRRIAQILGRSHSYWAEMYRLLLAEGALEVLHRAQPKRPAIYRVIANVSERKPARVYKGIEGFEVPECLEGFEVLIMASRAASAEGARRNPAPSGGEATTSSPETPRSSHAGESELARMTRHQLEALLADDELSTRERELVKSELLRHR